MKKHILIVEDEARLRKSVRYLMSDYGYEVTEAENGVDALALLSEDKSIDMVVTDIKMPLMSGIELIEEMGRRSMALPVCVVSGAIDVKVISSLHKLGCSDYLVKPFKREEFIQKINAILTKNAVNHQGLSPIV